MLKLQSITKDYVSPNQPNVHALKGITLNFRRSEFVAILGPSGCGKTTLLNIIGGLDKYTDGDLVIEGKSTKNYSSSDWNTYRNHSIGFVFQSYNLIPHITILANVELALTISGVSSAERKKKAAKALELVGLKGLEKKKPNQLSGGQMQRVAIARALVNDPEVLLADEPTGALDSETSVQVMNILKKVSENRLVIMVTHNPDLANEYATRIVNMKDGLVIDDSQPYEGETKEELDKAIKAKNRKFNKKQSSMSFKTSLGLSINNLLTKKGRTFLTSFAGSIGIIGIALILSVSYGTTEYVNRVQEDALTKYPMSVSQSSVDTSDLISAFIGAVTEQKGEQYPSGEKVGENDTLSSLANRVANSTVVNDLKYFYQYVNNPDVQNKYKDSLTSISYQYNVALQTYTNFKSRFGISEVKQAYPVTLKSSDYAADYGEVIKDVSPLLKTPLLEVIKTIATFLNSNFSNSTFPTYCQLIPSIDPSRTNEYAKIIDDQYDLLKGKMPVKSDEVVIIVDSYNNISDYVLYGLGLKNPKNLILNMVKSVGATYSISEEELDKIHLFKEDEHFVKNDVFSMSFDDVLGLEYYLPLAFQSFKGPYKNTTTGNYYYKNKSASEMSSYLKSSFDTEEEAVKNNGEYVADLKVVGIVRAKKGVTTECLTGGIGYLPSLVTDYLIDKNCGTKADGSYKYPLSGIYKEPTNKADPSLEKNIIAAHLKQELTMEKAYDLRTGNPYYILKDTEVKDAEMIFNRQTVKDFLLTFVDEKDLKSDDPAIQTIINYFLKQTMLYSTLGTTIKPSSLVVKLNNGKSIISGPSSEVTIAKLMEDHPEIFAMLPEETKQRLLKEYKDMVFEVGTMQLDGTNVGTVVYNYNFVLLADQKTITDNMTFKDSQYYSTCDYAVSQYVTNGNAYTLANNLKIFGICDITNPTSIYFYPKDFESKNAVKQLVNKYNKYIESEVKKDYKKYNDGKEPASEKEKELIVDRYKVRVNDTVGTLLTSVSTIINSVTYVLIAFVAISLIVSSVMIAIITYISVIERTKEIGILRALGARKVDISSVFNAETLIIGAISGLLGIGIAAILDIPIRFIITSLANVAINVSLPWYGAIILPLVAIALTVLSGFIPSIKAAKKDPVIALRSE